MALLTDGQTIINAEGPGVEALKSLGWTEADKGAEPKVVTNTTEVGALKIRELEVHPEPEPEPEPEPSKRTTRSK